jgi:hypothetical protein
MTATARKWFLALIVALVAVIVAISTAWISASSGNPLPSVIRDAGVAFGGTMTLGFVILGACHLLS